jgi:hypothetical protein
MPHPPTPWQAHCSSWPPFSRWLTQAPVGGGRGSESWSPTPGDPTRGSADFVGRIERLSHFCLNLAFPSVAVVCLACRLGASSRHPLVKGSLRRSGVPWNRAAIHDRKRIAHFCLKPGFSVCHLSPLACVSTRLLTVPTCCPRRVPW